MKPEHPAPPAAFAARPFARPPLVLDVPPADWAVLVDLAKSFGVSPETMAREAIREKAMRVRCAAAYPMTGTGTPKEGPAAGCTT